jgi:hypothetical protein
LKFEMKIFVFEIWKRSAIWREGNEKKWNEEIIYFIYATEKKCPIIPIYQLYHICISPYTTSASCGCIQLISNVGSFHNNLFEIVVYGGMVHRKRAQKEINVHMILHSLQLVICPLNWFCTSLSVDTCFFGMCQDWSQNEAKGPMQSMRASAVEQHSPLKAEEAQVMVSKVIVICRLINYMLTRVSTWRSIYINSEQRKGGMQVCEATWDNLVFIS